MMPECRRVPLIWLSKVLVGNPCCQMLFSVFSDTESIKFSGTWIPLRIFCPPYFSEAYSGESSGPTPPSFSDTVHDTKGKLLHDTISQCLDQCTNQCTNQCLDQCINQCLDQCTSQCTNQCTDQYTNQCTNQVLVTNVSIKFLNSEIFVTHNFIKLMNSKFIFTIFFVSKKVPTKVHHTVVDLYYFLFQFIIFFTLFSCIFILTMSLSNHAIFYSIFHFFSFSKIKFWWKSISINR